MGLPKFIGALVIDDNGKYGRTEPKIAMHMLLTSNNIDYFAMQYVKLKEGFITFTPKKNIL